MSSLSSLPDPGGMSVEELMEKLTLSANSSEKRGRARKNEYPTWDDPEVQVTGWKFNEFDYGSKNVKLPVDARGLFTYKDRIVIRGYNKFFNIDEVASTKWASIEKNTSAPYYLTSKENGCIVFMSAIDPDTLLVTSKNATGPGSSVEKEKSHSWVASQWIDRHLSKVGLTRSDLAKELHRLNVTAVGELCDDDFEEHVLAYTGDRAGIYLHGINLNTPKFATYSCEDVQAFAKQFGFFTTPYTVANSLPELKQFLSQCEEKGQWNGIDIEGFVIRCRASLDDGSEGDFFFKYKFQEPYLMYRNWREVTRSYLNGKAKNQIKINSHKTVTSRYLDFASDVLSRDHALREQYKQNHGIIKLRDMFLEHEGKQGIELANEPEKGSEEHQPIDDGKTKYVILPVSTIGCGKTTLFASLRHLFGWGHVQNDELQVAQKQKKHYLACESIRLLEDTGAVLVDRNNHKYELRATIMKDMNQCRKNLVFVCVNFWPNGKIAKEDLWKVTRKRVEERGDNHVTIKRSQNGDKETDKIMRIFVNGFEPLETSREPDDQFDSVIDLDVVKGTRQNLQLVVEQLHKRYPELVPEMPSEQALDEAFNAGLKYHAHPYKPDVQVLNYLGQGKGGPKKEQQAKGKGKDNVKEGGQRQPSPSKIIYFNVDVKQDISGLVDKLFEANPDADRSFWDKLKSSDFVKKEFHITLVHMNGSSDREKQLFEYLRSKYAGHLIGKQNSVNKSLDKECQVKAKYLAFNSRIMALAVDVTSDDDGIVCGTQQAHITIGMVDGVKPVESNDMLKSADKTVIDWNLESSLGGHQLSAFAR